MIRQDRYIVWNAHNTVFGSKGSAICAQAVRLCLCMTLLPTPTAVAGIGFSPLFLGNSFSFASEGQRSKVKVTNQSAWVFALL